MREREELFCDLSFGMSSKDKRDAAYVFLEVLCDIRDLLLEGLFEPEICDCEECRAKREAEEKAQAEIEVFEPTEELIDELFRKENGDV